MTDTFLGVSEVCPRLHARHPSKLVSTTISSACTQQKWLQLHYTSRYCDRVSACPVHVSACPEIRRLLETKIDWKSIIQYDRQIPRVCPRCVRGRHACCPSKLQLTTISSPCTVTFVIVFITLHHVTVSACLFRLRLQNGHVFGYLACKSVARVTQLYFITISLYGIQWGHCAQY